jgi:LPS export ABC transporter protein LptC
VSRILPLFALALLAFSACQDDAPVTVVTDGGVYLGADLVTLNGRHYFTQDGIRSATLVFDTMYQWNDSVNVHLRNPVLTVFHEDGSERATVTSLKGTLDRRAERMVARENVVLVVPDQDRHVETEELHYDPEGNRIFSDSAFVMVHQGRTLRGSSFTSDLEFRNFRIIGPGEN